MFQTGDPTGTGKGGNSIWGRKFEDEFHETLKVCYNIVVCTNQEVIKLMTRLCFNIISSTIPVEL